MKALFNRLKLFYKCKKVEGSQKDKKSPQPITKRIFFEKSVLSKGEKVLN